MIDDIFEVLENQSEIKSRKRDVFVGESLDLLVAGIGTHAVFCRVDGRMFRRLDLQTARWLMAQLGAGRTGFESDRVQRAVEAAVEAGMFSWQEMAENPSEASIRDEAAEWQAKVASRLLDHFEKLPGISFIGVD